MKASTKSLLLMMIMAGAVVAGAQNGPGATTARTGGAATVKPVTHHNASPVARAQTRRAKPARTAKRSAKPTTAEEKSGESGRTKISAHGKRDPFVSIIRSGGGAGTPCTSGKQCLVVDQIVLKGIVRWNGGTLAVVENNRRKPYFLKEKDPVFNGEVVKITSDSIVFREKVIDKLGREASREIVKRLNRPA